MTEYLFAFVSVLVRTVGLAVVCYAVLENGRRILNGEDLLFFESE